MNGAVLSLAVCGYHVPVTFCSFPWLLYYVFRLERRRADGVLLGFWLAFTVSNEINYYNVYSLTVVSVVWLRGALARAGPARRRFLIHTVLAAGVVLALAGWRLATTGLVYRDFPRPFKSSYDLSPWSILTYMLSRPKAVDLAQIEIPYFWETLWYVGPVVVVLAAASLIGGWRWWHTLTAVCIWLAAGSVAWYHPSYWLSHFPVYTSMHVVTRWRIMAMLGIALAVADVLARWRRSALAGAAAARGGRGAGHRGGLHVPRLPGLAPGIPDRTDRVAVSRAADAGCDPARRLARIRGRAARLRSDPPPGTAARLLLRGATARRWRGHPEYAGEYWTAHGPVRPRSWSPNRIVFQVEPGETVFVNQNPGSWWLVNGHPAFPEWRCAETERMFQVQADDQGKIDLQIRPRGLGLGLGLHIAGAAIVGLALVLSWWGSGSATERAP